MKDHLRDLLDQAVASLRDDGTLPAEGDTEIQIDRTKDAAHGDFAANIALVLSKAAGLKPRDLAQRLVDALPESRHLSKVEIAGPGFINFFIDPAAVFAVVDEVLAQGDAFGRGTLGAGKRVIVEFVSANPTGPLHVGHGRGAAFGGALSTLLSAAGYDVHREYYVNDAGRQMDILATSV